jgi:hypothetical protein
MLALLMISALCRQPPSIVFEQPEELAERHISPRRAYVGFEPARRPTG